MSLLRIPNVHLAFSCKKKENYLSTQSMIWGKTLRLRTVPQPASKGKLSQPDVICSDTGLRTYQSPVSRYGRLSRLERGCVLGLRRPRSNDDNACFGFVVVVVFVCLFVCFVSSFWQCHMMPCQQFQQYYNILQQILRVSWIRPCENKTTLFQF